MDEVSGKTFHPSHFLSPVNEHGVFLAYIEGFLEHMLMGIGIWLVSLWTIMIPGDGGIYYFL